LDFSGLHSERSNNEIKIHVLIVIQVAEKLVLVLALGAQQSTAILTHLLGKKGLFKISLAKRLYFNLHQDTSSLNG
jgi:hypothetical protein